MTAKKHHERANKETEEVLCIIREEEGLKI